jgi:DNA-binding response OmpR family regulator
MNSNQLYRALVVDDEPLVRQATMRSLSRAGFVCDAARDGAEADELVGQQRYDLVLTDLRMPGVNGHQLVVSLLAMANRPAVVVLTGVAEPKIAADLKTRGVDEILFKPLEYDELARRVLTIVRERAKLKTVAVDTPVVAPVEQTAETDVTREPETTPEESVVLEAQVARATGELRKPPADFDAFARASGNGFNAKALANAVESNPGFVVEVLRLTNSMLYTSNKSTAELKNSMESLERRATLRSVAIFAGGAVLGWLFSLISAAAIAWRS